jgi:hypothetical protein
MLKKILIADLCLGKHKVNENYVRFSPEEELRKGSLSVSTSALYLAHGQLRTVGRTSGVNTIVCFIRFLTYI